MTARIESISTPKCLFLEMIRLIGIMPKIMIRAASRIAEIIHSNWVSMSMIATLCLVARLGRYLIIFLGGLFQPKATLVTMTLALQSQLAACIEQIERKETPKPQFHPAFRLLWVLISKVIDDWQDLVQVKKHGPMKLTQNQTPHTLGHPPVPA